MLGTAPRTSRLHLEMFHLMAWINWSWICVSDSPDKHSPRAGGGAAELRRTQEEGLFFSFLVCLSLLVSTTVDSNAVKSLLEVEEPYDGLIKTPRSRIKTKVPQGQNLSLNPQPWLAGELQSLFCLSSIKHGTLHTQKTCFREQGSLETSRVVNKNHSFYMISSTGAISNRKIPLPLPFLPLKQFTGIN